jgi:FkbH-like protein
MTVKKTYAQIQAETGEKQLAGLPPLHLTVLRNVMVEPIEPYLRYCAREIGLRAAVRYGGYNTLYQEAVGGAPELLHGDTGCVLVWIKLENLSWDLARNFNGRTPAERQAEVERVRTELGEIARGIRRQTRAVILWFGFDLPLEPALGIADAQSEGGQRATIDGLNRWVRELLREQGNAYAIEMDLIVGRVGASQFHDARYWHMGRAPYGREALREMAYEAFKYVRALRGKSRKCLALDCDNVLWGGIVGEDGLAGIKLGKTHPGSAYREFQQQLLELHHRGVLLALCSKNNEADVWEVFDRHPDMVLRREHIAAWRINWEDKAANLRQIAGDLNLGIDSLVFADDSDFEVQLVRELVPEVEVIHLPKETAVENRDRLAACGWFDTPTVSAEDARRGALYAAEAQREQLRTGARDLAGYCASLEMELEIRFASEFSIPRIAQLTQKTNQFNLTTRRYTDLEIRDVAGSGAADVFSLRLSDRFGDAGIVGAAILKYAGEAAVIDTLLLSCRVLGRQVEDALLGECIQRACSKGCRTLKGEYLPTAKNGQVRDFYPARGFRRREDTAGEFELDLAGPLPPAPAVFRRIDSEVNPASVRGASGTGETG